jgi:two-component system, cell cycle response regulator
LQKVLIIDAAPAVHSALAVCLKDEPVTLHAANDGEGGFKAASEIAPDLILLDVDLPELNGFEVCRRLKRGKRTREIPVILLTSATSSAERMRGLELGALDYITKPIDHAEVLARVWAALRASFFLNLLSKKAMIDGVTGLWNRQYFEQRMSAEISLARRSSRPVSCIICDIDGFEKIAESHGYPGADEVLRGVGQFLVNNCRMEDVICRFTGEQFGIVAPNTGAEGAADLSNRLCATLAHADLLCRGQQIRVTCSFGLCDLEMAGTKSITELTEQAMHRAKQVGGNRVETHKPSLAA